jgi:hypothetical protein
MNFEEVLDDSAVHVECLSAALDARSLGISALDAVARVFVWGWAQ